MPASLDLAVLDHLLHSLESTLVGLGARHVWIDPSRPELAVMADLPREAD